MNGYFHSNKIAKSGDACNMRLLLTEDDLKPGSGSSSNSNNIQQVSGFDSYSSTDQITALAKESV